MNIIRLLMIAICGAVVAGCGGAEDRAATETDQQGYATAGGDQWTQEREQPMRSEYGPERQREDVAQHQEHQRQMNQTNQYEQPGQIGQQAEMAQQGELAMRKGDENVTIAEVLYVRDRDRNRANLVFFRDDVDCAAVRETPTGDDAFVAMVEVEPGTDGMPRTGQLPPARWTYQTGQQPQVMQGQPGWVSITRVPDTSSIEGQVTVATTVEDERFELNGPFTATVCEVTATAVPTGGTRR